MLVSVRPPLLCYGSPSVARYTEAESCLLHRGVFVCGCRAFARQQWRHPPPPVAPLPSGSGYKASSAATYGPAASNPGTKAVFLPWQQRVGAVSRPSSNSIALRNASLAGR